MTKQEAVPRAAPWRRTAWQGSKRAALWVLFTAVLMIPRVRRLRRKPRAWTTIRLAAGAAGAYFVWRFIHVGVGAGYLGLGLALLCFGLLARARPETKSVDQQARDFNALVVLNGGTFVPAPGAKPSGRTRIFVNPERLFVLDGGDRLLVEIPLAAACRLAARAIPVEDAARYPARPWELEITWQPGNEQRAVFRFEGLFAEHLVRVAETTIRTLMRKELPVLKA